jgi:hypothetical protein
VNELIAFLEANNDADEAAASEAMWTDLGGGSENWTAYHREKYDSGWAVIDGLDDGVITTVDPQAVDGAAVAQHIARHDPARVLRECEARRRLIADWRIARGAEKRARNRWLESGAMTGSEEQRSELYIRAIVGAHENAIRLSAQGFADRPEFRDEWRIS